MLENIVLQTIKNIVPNDVCTSMCGAIIGAGTTSCKLDKKYGGVYGIAVQLTPSDIPAFIAKNNLNHKNIKSLSDWKSLGENFYPLYWGKDSRLLYPSHE